MVGRLCKQAQPTQFCRHEIAPIRTPGIANLVVVQIRFGPYSDSVVTRASGPHVPAPVIESRTLYAQFALGFGQCAGLLLAAPIPEWPGGAVKLASVEVDHIESAPVDQICYTVCNSLFERRFHIGQ